ncbi:hypothetical protein H0O02_03155, partial [Candidatus Micrarchaeota archaeon]|nr:hypothetical protein [Candidatus Micrarchaeota archaeon]
SDMNGAEAKWNSAKSKTNSYLYSNPNSTATLLNTKLETIDVTGMGVFAEMLERDYSKSCVETKTTTGYSVPLSKGDALDLVVNEVVGANNYYVYMIDSPLTPGTVVTFPRDEGDYELTIAEPAWFFYVDTQPFAPFAHPTKFVLVNVADGSYQLYNESYSPVINGITYWSTYEERINRDNIVYPQNASVEFSPAVRSISESYEYRAYYYSLAAAGSGIPVGTPVPFPDEKCCEDMGRKKYALVITGYDEPMFQSDTARMYDYLKGQGYADGDITYLTAAGGEANSDGQTTLERVKNALNNIAANAKCCDEVFIYMSGHGSPIQFWQYKNRATGATTWATGIGVLEGGVAAWEATGSTGYFHRITMNPGFATPGAAGAAPVAHGSADGGRMFAYEFSGYFDKIQSCYVTIMYFSCYSGIASPTIQGKGRTVITPTGNTVAWGYPANGSIFTNFFTQAKTDAGVKDEANTDGQDGVSDKEAFDWAKKKTQDWIKKRNDTVPTTPQDGVYTPTTERCRCCHVICNDAKTCSVIEGDGADSVLCPKVGDYCGQMERPPNVTTHTECSNYECIVVESEGEDQCVYDADCGQKPPEEAVCGDGKTTAPEECDLGSTTTNKCPEGKYCKSDCKCHTLETSVVCGDGKISSPNEDCDGGSVLTDICQQGYGCYACKCKPIEAVCGDGRINPPEECDHGNTITQRCSVTGEVCQSCQCIPTSQATHSECVEEQCVEVQGYGEDQCFSDEECRAPKHSECLNEQCIEVDGEGVDECIADSDCGNPPECGDQRVEGWEQCEKDSDCGSGKICIGCLCYEIPAFCGDGNLDQGEECEKDSDCREGGVCGGNCKCVYPPSLNCDYICGQMGLPVILGHGFATADACGAAAEEEPTTCYTTCIKYGFGRVDNIAGWDSCCCKKKEMFPCTNCPGQNPQCPECPSGYQ